MNTNDVKTPIRTEMRGRTLWIWIDREERRNAINRHVISGIAAAIEAARETPLALDRAHGRGPESVLRRRRSYRGSVHLHARSRRADDGFRQARAADPRTRRPPCSAGSMAIASPAAWADGLCDLVVVADHARFGLPEAKVGVFPMQVLVFLRGMIGARHINELCLTGELIDAARAREIGIANYVAPYDLLDARVEALSPSSHEMSPTALRRGKYAIAAMERMAFPKRSPSRRPRFP